MERNVGLWDYSDTTYAGDLTGYSVEATDGEIGKVDEATNDVGSSYIVVDTGPWIFGTKRMLPAGVIDRVDRDDERVYVNRSKDEIKDSPEFDDSTYREDTYRDDIGAYYGRQRTGVGGGPMDPV
jgi:hypothetical protein